jgi:hypothetical protein
MQEAQDEKQQLKRCAHLSFTRALLQGHYGRIVITGHRQKYEDAKKILQAGAILYLI